MNKRAVIGIIVILSAFFIFLGCATIPPEETNMKESLRSTAERYWKLRMEDKYEAAYRLEDGEGLPPFQDYLNKVMAMKKFTILSHAVKDIHVDRNKGIVDVEFSFSMPTISKPFKQTIKDLWIYKNGKWQHRLNPE